MATYTAEILSGSTNGRPIAVAATATPGTLIHTATAVVGAMEEVYLYAANVTASPVLLTIQWGGVTTADTLTVSIPANSGLVQVGAGQRLNGGVVVRAFAATASAINITGLVNLIAQ